MKRSVSASDYKAREPRDTLMQVKYIVLARLSGKEPIGYRQKEGAKVMTLAPSSSTDATALLITAPG
jgi:hypothetical protein